MPVFEDIDLSQVTDGVPEGSHEAIITKVEYQVKVGEKWNNDGTETVDAVRFMDFPVEKRRLRLTLAVPGKGNIWEEFYLTEKSLPFLKRLWKACKLVPGKLDPDQLLNAHVGIKVIIKDERPEISGFFQA